MSSIIKKAKRLIIKVGSSLVTNDGHGLDLAAVATWAKQIAKLHEQGKEIILVSSGAIAEGMLQLGFKQRPEEVNELQACAAVGQMGLAQIYQTSFDRYGLKTAQILLTHADFADRTRYLNARATLLALFRLNVLPIINENDTVVTDEIKFGDNDTLGSLVANLIEADALIILTDQKGLFTADPRKDSSATLITEAYAGDSELEKMAGGTGSGIGRGGMLTKILAAKRAARSGAHTIIAWGREPNALIRLSEGEMIGTQLLAPNHHLQAKKQWMADHLQTAGKVFLDAGAIQKIQKEGKSLLPIGIIRVEGEFVRGEIVSCIDGNGHEIARGLANYSSRETALIARHKSTDITNILGYDGDQEFIHRDNMIVLQD